MNASTDCTTPLALRLPADLADRVTLLHLEGDLAATRPGVVGGGRELVADELRTLGDRDVRAGRDQRERHQRGEAPGDAAAPSLAAAAFRRVVLDSSTSSTSTSS
jgi:hypothetical protein